MLNVNRAMVDTSALYALVCDKDEFHDEAVFVHQELVDHAVELYTNSYVLVEAIALAQRRLGLTKAQELVGIIQRHIQVIWIDRPAHWGSWELLQQHSGRLSLVDCSVIVAARRMNCAVFTFDRDFRDAGLPVLPDPASNS